MFREFVVLCRRLELFGRELLAVDGTRIKAVNSKDRNFTKGALEKFIAVVDARLDEYLGRLDTADVQEAGVSGSRVRNLAEKIATLRKKRSEYEALRAQIERSGDNQISLTDPDSRAMAAHTKVGVGYNVQIAVDAKNKLIVEQAVTNDVTDAGLLHQTAEPARRMLAVDQISVVADRGYYKIEDIVACEQAGIVPYVSRPQRGPAVINGFFRKDEFVFDAARDAYICPAGQILTRFREGRLRGLKKIEYGAPAACRQCSLRDKCAHSVRSVTRIENEDALDRMAVRVAAHPTIMHRRREIVEHPFGSIKQWMRQSAFLTRGLDNVRAEFSLTALAYNLRRAINILGVARMRTAVSTGADLC